MAMELRSASFEDVSLGMGGTSTDDRQVMSVLFDDLKTESAPADVDAAPQVRRAEGEVTCSGRGWVSVQVRGTTAMVGGHGYAHALGWANGRRLRAAAHVPGESNEPFVSAVVAPVGNDGRLRLSLLLLAQRDLEVPRSAAACWVDSIDIAVLPDPHAQTRRAPK